MIRGFLFKTMEVDSERQCGGCFVEKLYFLTRNCTKDIVQRNNEIRTRAEDDNKQKIHKKHMSMYVYLKFSVVDHISSY